MTNANSVTPAGWEMLPEDLRTHLGDFKEAVRLAAASGDDDGYWARQARVIKRIEAQLNTPAPAVDETIDSRGAAVAAIDFALEPDSDGLEFLRNWFVGNFEAIRKEWPEAPEAVFIGADPLHSQTKALLAQGRR